MHSIGGDQKVELKTLFSLLNINFIMRIVAGKPGIEVKEAEMEYGPILHLRFGSKSILVVSSPSAVEECFTKNDIIFANRPRSSAGDHFTYNYTAFSWAPYGHLWRSLRRFSVVEVFSSNSLQKSSTILENEIARLLRQVLKQSRRNPGIEDEAADLEVAKKFLLEFKEKFYPSVAVDICDFFPILRLIGYKGRVEKSLSKVQKSRDEYMQGLIDEIRLKKTNSSFQKKTSLIETLLSLQESEPEFYTDDVIKSIMVVMLVAGVDTTAITLEWAMSLLLNHPEALKKLRAEIDGNVGDGRMLNDLDLVKLPYLRCVGNEVDMSEQYGLSLTKAEPLVAFCSPRQNMIEMLSAVDLLE
ncbi:hypothetical protein Patl1_08872 [Pistacia atlantica]|uniref:Uncharacterized protein n=1 Tax=Pistacia atlantica TaxID=434234 RepID=A0ACC1AEX1_9ROSI|nr:hypothetical protein Patl1_08872 [Pistacia atlantica]